MNQPAFKQISQTLEAKPEILLAWIYGSFAQGTETPTSDVDVAVAAKKLLLPDERVQLALELSTALGREVDLVDLRTERGIIASQVLTQGILLVKKDRDLLAGLIKRMWLDRADFWPHREKIFQARRDKAFGKSSQ